MKERYQWAIIIISLIIFCITIFKIEYNYDNSEETIVAKRFCEENGNTFKRFFLSKHFYCSIRGKFGNHLSERLIYENGEIKQNV